MAYIEKWENTPENLEKLEMLLFATIGYMNGGDETTPELEKAYKSLSGVCQRFTTQYHIHCEKE